MTLSLSEISGALNSLARVSVRAETVGDCFGAKTLDLLGKRRDSPAGRRALTDD